MIATSVLTNSLNSIYVFVFVIAIIGAAFDQSQVQLAGDGLMHAKVNHQASFLIDCNEAGVAAIAVEIMNVDGSPLNNVQVHDNGNNTFT